MAGRERAVRQQSGQGVGGKLKALAGGIMERVRRIPLWIWLLIVGAVVVIYLIYRNGGIGGGASGPSSLGSLPGVSSGASGDGTTVPGGTGTTGGTGTSGTAPATGGDATGNGALSTLSTIDAGSGSFAPSSNGGGTSGATGGQFQFQPFGADGSGGPTGGTDARSDPSYGSGYTGASNVPLNQQGMINTHAGGTGASGKASGVSILGSAVAKALGVGRAASGGLTATQAGQAGTASHTSALHVAAFTPHPAAHLAAPRTPARRAPAPHHAPVRRAPARSAGTTGHGRIY